MAIVKEATPGAQDLSTFQNVIQQQEGIFGPLLSISSSDATNNVMTFQIGPSHDSDHRVILDTYIDYPTVKVDYTLVCIGNCLVSGAIKSVAAYRKKP